MAKLIGASINLLLWLVILSITAVVAYEYALPAARSASLKTAPQFHPFSRAGYYKTTRPGDPYALFSRQHLHPTYLFFFPLDPAEREKLSNEIVSLTKDGFRTDGPTADKPLAVVLGGSAAFGYQASSDRTTITGYLNQFQSSYHFLNAGVPSWNSTQELHRLADQIVPLAPGLVISYSFSNDIITALTYARKGLDYPAGSPESFEHLTKRVDDIRGATRDRVVERYFPRTLNLINNLGGKRDVVTRQTSDRDLLAAVGRAADKFVSNQSIMHTLASGMNTRFVTVIQPSLRTHSHVSAKDRRDERERRLFQHAVDRILASSYCQKHCLNYSRIFDKEFSTIPVFRSIEETPDLDSLIFVDSTHLLDSGNRHVARQLIRDLALDSRATSP